MASLSFSTLPTSTTTNTTNKRLLTQSSPSHSNPFKVSCKAADDNENSDLPPKYSSFERRNLLLGLGGLYGAANIPSAFGVPIEAPDSAASCFEAFSSVRNPKEALRGLACCPPIYSKAAPVPYVFPTVDKLRERKPAHLLSKDADYVEQFRAGIQILKELPDDDPHSWKNQAKIHCAYCNGGYRQEKSGFPDLEIQVHNSWLFLPFHRWYLYFLEKIIGKHLKDDTFALPYWNWDNPEGMSIPLMYEVNDPIKLSGGEIVDKTKIRSLYDPFRDQFHAKPKAILDFNYGGQDVEITPEEQMNINLALMYRQMVSSGYNTRLFMGGEVKAGVNPISQNVKDLSLGGSLENGVHTAAHRWVGNRRMPNGEDMGNFYSAGFDPVFYAHHANVDRMWNVWKALGKKLGKPGHVDPTKPDWENASYVFYDENRVRVRVYNKDCVDTQTMGYTYQPSKTPWVSRRPTASPSKVNIIERAMNNGVKKVEDPDVLPLTLTEKTPVSVLVSRSKTSPEDKKKENEMVCFSGIKYDCEKFVRFNVIVNDPGEKQKPVDKINAAAGQFVGSFAQLPHNHGGVDMKMSTSVEFGITELLEDTEAEQTDSILVTIVPVIGCEGVIITGINVKVVKAEGETESETDITKTDLADDIEF
ncbi:hypothetical protein LXL04_016421 [Taraxacum kok-saghyz]